MPLAASTCIDYRGARMLAPTNCPEFSVIDILLGIERSQVGY